MKGQSLSINKGYSVDTYLGNYYLQTDLTYNLLKVIHYRFAQKKEGIALRKHENIEYSGHFQKAFSTVKIQFQ